MEIFAINKLLRKSRFNRFRHIKRWQTLSLLVLFLCGVSTTGFSQQDKKVSFGAEKELLTKALDRLAQTSGINIVYPSKEAGKFNVSISKESRTLETTLQLLLKPTTLDYEFVNGKVVVFKKKAGPSKAAAKITVKGLVTDEENQPLSGITVLIKGSSIGTATNSNGTFQIDNVPEDAIVELSGVGYEKVEQPVSEWFKITLIKNGLIMEDVTVSTGYQTLPKERATGSFEQIDNTLFNRRTGANIIDRLENVASGFYKNQNDVGPDEFTIRGRSTLYADSKPLIILDNFPFDGNISDINPNDVESVTLLKDAAASSIWGARAGNGVIVITTKNGKTRRPTVQLNTNLTFTGRPDFNNLHIISSADYIELEKYLFAKGYYQADENNLKEQYGFAPFTPVIELLIKQRDGLISDQEANSQIESFKQYDANRDIKKYLYQNSFNQQYSLNVSGKSEMTTYYFSGGYDKGRSNLVSEGTERITLRNANTFQLSKRLSIDIGLNFIQSTYHTGQNEGINTQSNTGRSLYPYARLADDQGNTLPVYFNYTQSFLMDAVSKGLLSWEIDPIDDISYRNYKNQTRSLIANAGISYNILKGLSFGLKYQYLYSGSNTNNGYDKDAYYTRDLINRFTQINADGSLTRPIPEGDIITRYELETFSHHGRAQLDYNRIWKGEHQVAAIAGWEISDVGTKGYNSTFYGYNKIGSVTTGSIDFVTRFPQYQNGILAPYVTAAIPNATGISGTTDRYLSYFGNASYTYKSRYTVSASAREDASNLFGVKTNQKQVPLWSAGLAWEISKEHFYSISGFPYLKLRASYGSQGNVSKRASAYTTGTYGEGVSAASFTGLRRITIQTPPNEALRWETINMFNVGMDFSSRNNRVSGSVEYYRKKGHDILGEAPLDPTNGISLTDGIPMYFGNLAGIRGYGYDIKINGKILNGSLNWDATLLYSYTISKVSSYGQPVSTLGNAYLGDYMINPVLGENVYAIYAFKWAGLNPENGNPRGYLDGEVSDDAAAIYNRTQLEDMLSYSQQPTSFGAVRNTFNYKDFSVSVNISYKFDYYFRRRSVRYSQLFSSWSGHDDYANRWQNPGDELYTDIPSMIYPASTTRESYFLNSSALIEKGDHIRLEDIAASYVLSKKSYPALPFQSIRFYAYVTNLGLIWAANNKGIDPNYTYTPMPAKSFALGININF